MLKRWKRERELKRAARRMAEERRRGQGVYVSEWDVQAEHHSIVETIVDWCRDTMGRCRRPFGIDHFDLALALGRHDADRPVTTVYRLRPADLYTESAAEHLAAFLFGAKQPPARVAVALFSWGDAAHRAFPNDF
jgi:hypothetical protein